MNFTENLNGDYPLGVRICKNELADFFETMGKTRSGYSQDPEGISQDGVDTISPGCWTWEPDRTCIIPGKTPATIYCPIGEKSHFLTGAWRGLVWRIPESRGLTFQRPFHLDSRCWYSGKRDVHPKLVAGCASPQGRSD